MWATDTGIGPIDSIAVTPDGRRAVLGARKSVFLALDLHAAESRREIMHLDCEQPIWAVTISADGRQGLYGTADGRLGRVDLEQASKHDAMHRHSTGITLLASVADGSLVGSVAAGGKLHVWDFLRSQSILERVYKNRISACAFCMTPLRAAVVTGDDSGWIQVTPLDKVRQLH